ncbi:MAG: hypothetical protein JWO85_2569 [Candidatus Eremiobacteraeota bacterium]|nr:hypothetical protein [Candidatus Eremiobacteraeota bacterium]
MSEADPVRVYYPDGTTEMMTRGEHRAKLLAWIEPFVRPGGDIQVSLDGASVRVIRNGTEPSWPFPPPWVCDANPPSPRVEIDPATGRQAEVRAVNFDALGERPNIKLAVAQREFGAAMRRAFEPFFVSIIRWLDARLRYFRYIPKE